jgi:mono/diheme cytochrome c family protein
MRRTGEFGNLWALKRGMPMWILRSAVLVPAALALSGCAHPGSHQSATVQSGAQLFRAHCSSCHGLQAHGDGPDAHTIDIPVPDLTRVASRNGGEFPSEKVYQIIDGQSEIPAHGTRPMPLWGYDFFGGEGDDESEHRQASEKIDSLVAYLASIQRR